MAVSVTISLQFLFNCTFFDPSIATYLLDEPGIEVEVERQAQVSWACFKSIAAERAKDVRSLTWSYEALEGAYGGKVGKRTGKQTRLFAFKGNINISSR